MKQDVVLLARTPSGDAAFVGRETSVWLLRPDGSRPSSEAEAQHAIANLDFEAVGKRFSNWGDLEEDLLRVADAWRREHNWPGIADYSLKTLREIVADAEEAGGDQYQLAVALLGDCPAARTDETLYQRIVALLSRHRRGLAIPAAANSIAQERALKTLAA